MALTKEEDYAFGRPSLTRKKLRALELLAGADRQHSGGRPKAGTETTLKARMREEIELSRQAETAYRRLVKDWQQSVEGANATRGRASSGRHSGKQRGKASVPNPAL